MRGEGGEGGGTVQKGQGREEPGASKGRESEKVDWKEKESEGVGRREPSSIPLTAAAIQTQEERFCSPEGGEKVKNYFFEKTLSQTEEIQKIIWRGQGISRKPRWIQTPVSRAMETSLQVRQILNQLPVSSLRTIPPASVPSVPTSRSAARVRDFLSVPRSASDAWAACSELRSTRTGGGGA